MACFSIVLTPTKMKIPNTCLCSGTKDYNILYLFSCHFHMSMKFEFFTFDKYQKINKLGIFPVYAIFSDDKF